MITVTPTAIPAVLLIHPQVFPDDRGAFLASFNAEEFAAAGITDTFLQDNLSISKQGVLRGLHFQKPPFAQSKLVSVVMGKVFDVAVDIRKDSPTYGKWVSAILDDQNHDMLYVPVGFAHGFYVLSAEARFSYKIGHGAYNKEASSGILWNDPTLNINWPLDLGSKEPMLSEQDKKLPLFDQLN